LAIKYRDRCIQTWKEKDLKRKEEYPETRPTVEEAIENRSTASDGSKRAREGGSEGGREADLKSSP